MQSSYIPPVIKDEIKKALKAIQKGKAAGKDQLTAVVKDGVEIGLEKWPRYIRKASWHLAHRNLQ